MARKKPKTLPRGVFSLAVLICCMLVALTSLERQWKADAVLQRKIDASVQALEGQDLNLPLCSFRLEILSAKRRQRNARQLDLMLRATGDPSGTLVFTDRDIGAFTMSAQALDRRQHLVNTYLEGYEPFKVDNVVLPLYIIARRKSYQSDRIQYAGREEVWQSSRQSYFYPRGDCEDHAILLADWLISMGEDARVVVGEVKGGGHAWVVLFKNGTEYLLEATQKSGLSRTKAYPLTSLYPQYNPSYMFNREYFWENTGSLHTTKYSGRKWKKKSRLEWGQED